MSEHKYVKRGWSEIAAIIDMLEYIKEKRQSQYGNVTKLIFNFLDTYIEIIDAKAMREKSGSGT